VYHTCLRSARGIARDGAGGRYNLRAISSSNAPAAQTANPLFWDDAYPIALLLKRQHSAEDPLALDDVALRSRVIGLADFADDPDGAQATWLEDIRREWVELH